MKISIITPSYNSGSFIEKNILSVLKQDYTNVEHIIHDNYSNDKTHSILEKYKHLKISVEKDEGQSDALNKMIKKSRGDLIGWLNADDYYSENVFNHILNNFKQNPELDAIYSDFNIVDEKDQYIRSVKSLEFIPSLSPFLCFIPSTTFFCKASLIKNNKIKLNKNFHFMMDKDFFCQLIRKSKKFKKLNIVIANFRRHKNAKTSFHLNNKSKKIFYYEGIEIINKYSLLRLKKNFLGTYFYRILIFFFSLLGFLIKNFKFKFKFNKSFFSK